MQEITVAEALAAWEQAGHTLDEMYKRNPDTKISAILAEKRSGLLAQDPEQKK